MFQRPSSTTRIGRIRRLTILNLIVLGVLLVLTACGGQRIVIPAKDPTPPTIEMIVSVGSQTVTVTPDTGNMALNVGTASNITILAVARDIDGAVRNVTIEGGYNKVCVVPPDTQAVIDAGSVYEDNPQPGGIGSMGWTVLSTSYSIRTRDLPRTCPPGSTLEEVTGTFWATATNFGGVTVATDAIYITYP